MYKEMFAVRNQYNELKPDEGDNVMTNFKKAIISAVLLVSVSIFAWVAYSSYKYSGKAPDIEEIKLIRKDIAPLKTKPEEVEVNPQGTQEKMIYKNFESSTLQEPDAKQVDSTATVEAKEKVETKIPEEKQIVKQVENKDVVKKAEQNKPKPEVIKKKTDKKPGKSTSANSVFDVME